MNKKINSPLSEQDTKGEANSRVPFLLKLGHELKTPIHGITGISSYLQDNWNDLSDKTKLDSVAAIYNASENLSNLISTLLDKAKNHKQLDFNITKTDLVELTKTVIEDCRNLYSHKDDIEIKLQSNDTQILSMIDPFWYSQLLTNLISNSIHYSNKGTITVSLNKEQIKDIENFSVSISDQGIGISKEDLDAIFIPFNRGSKENNHQQGTGLGLAICQEIVEAHGGTISAYNNTDIGSTIKFSIPIKK
jgi:two-component system sensor histidine kinase KdpD